MKDQDVVVVIKLINGDELIAALVSRFDDRVRVCQPYKVDADRQDNSLTILPYCLFSDEKFFEFRLTDILFLVPATPPVAQHYFSLIESHVVKATRVTRMLPKASPQTEEFLFVTGNDTKH